MFVSCLPRVFPGVAGARGFGKHITRNSHVEFHEAANIFPLDEEHIGELAVDIRQQGLLYPVEVLDGKILDGRRRWLACKRAGVEADIVEVNPDDPVDYVVSLNLRRRQLTKSQAAACAARADKLREKYEKDAKERQKEHGSTAPGKPKNTSGQLSLSVSGRSRDQIAEAFGVSGKTVDRVRKAIRDGIPELAKAIEAGQITANKAVEISSYQKPSQKALLDEVLKRKPTHSPQPSQQPATKKPEEKGSNKSLTERYAISTADVAITQLKAIPPKNPFRAREFGRVQKYLEKELIQ